jgi:hypothetical protein
MRSWTVPRKKVDLIDGPTLAEPIIEQNVRVTATNR